ncbi:polysaccharide deacetylase family protein [Bdellovibrio sp. ZAP7]|uniref:polysaccharide deacetylase family protein n=1 Tax=Bdellovibrio sp. ZAP7 TaxID=2231053 RepID=UPI0011586568|nr:polysaccharide deacetylase family protein [Bdellovibrio sp. ZAP7]QDK44176.1 polysaccharide deacetylase family protein [Bdellovibrio sp. ZAP7]
MKSGIVLVVTAGMLSLTACNSGFDVAKQDLQLSLSDNQAAVSIAAWEGSENHPDRVFEKWQSEIKAKSLKAEEVCQALLEADGPTLSLMAPEIERAENAEMLKGCKADLLAKVQKFYEDDRDNLTMNLENFFGDQTTPRDYRPVTPRKFPDNVQIRDMSNGYYAVNADVAPGEVILTFDDGPSEKYTQIILKTLKQMNAKAIFFHLGKNVNANPNIVKMVAADGHSIGGHSMSHRCLANKTICAKNNGGKALSFKQATEEIAGSMNAIKNTLGWVDPFFRFPYGEYDKSLTAYLNNKGIGNFYWRIDSNDWKSQTPSNLIKNTMNQVKAAGKGIILFHDIHQRTAEALPEILSQLYSGGYKIVLLKPKKAMTVPVNPAP